MCGVAGYIRLDGKDADPTILHAMCDAIEHRGPDSEGVFVDGPAALGMRRLAIIDLEGGRQPMHSEDGQLTIVFNGECYDFNQVRPSLEAAGAKFSTSSDTECVLRAIELFGDDGVDRFRGMFAFAVWNRERRRLLLVRDRIGQKPMHWYRDDGHFIFGSEIKSILVAMARLGVPRPEPCPKAIPQYLAYGYVPDPLTLFEGIRKLPPGHRLILENGEVREEPWWTLNADARFEGSGEDALERLDHLLEDAVGIRLVSDVPLGAFLSGGVDSSTVVGMMGRSATERVKTFSIGFEDGGFDELRYARRVAEHLGTQHFEEIVKPDAARLIEDILRHFDEPFADSSAIPTYYVSRMARKHVTVALSGDGGDELFHGYARYGRTSAGAWPLFRPLLRLGASVLPLGFFGRARLWNLSLGDDERYIHHLTCGLSEWHSRFFTTGFRGQVGDTDPSGPYLEILRRHPSMDRRSRRALADTLIYLPGDIMTKVDRMSMMVSLEARAPLLDHHVVEFAQSLPPELKWRDGQGKWLLKKLARRLVPPEVIDRKKMGFAVPISSWFNAAWMRQADAWLDGFAERDIVRRQAIRRLRHEHRQGRRDHSQLLWSLMVLEMWYRDYVDGRCYSS